MVMAMGIRKIEVEQQFSWVLLEDSFPFQRKEGRVEEEGSERLVFERCKEFF